MNVKSLVDFPEADKTMKFQEVTVKNSHISQCIMLKKKKFAKDRICQIVFLIYYSPRSGEFEKYFEENDERTIRFVEEAARLTIGIKILILGKFSHKERD